MFPSSAILEEMFPSDRDGNNIRRRYAISAIPGFKWRKGDVATFSGDRGSIREEYMLRHFLGFKWRLELKIISRMRSLGLSSVHVSP